MIAESLSTVIKSGAKYGALAGFIATWSISTAIAASELELGLPMGMFYAIMGSSLGFGNLAVYAGFAMHIATGTALGAVIGYLAARSTTILLRPYRAIAMGIAAGLGVWVVLFLPLTLLVVQPPLSQVSGSMPFAGQPVWGIALSAIAFHGVWGAIFGYVASTLMRIRAFRMEHKEEGMVH